MCDLCTCLTADSVLDLLYLSLQEEMSVPRISLQILIIIPPNPASFSSNTRKYFLILILGFRIGIPDQIGMPLKDLKMVKSQIIWRLHFIIGTHFLSTWTFWSKHLLRTSCSLKKTPKPFMSLKIRPNPQLTYDVLKFKNPLKLKKNFLIINEYFLSMKNARTIQNNISKLF